MTITNTAGVFIVIDGGYKYATKGTVVIYKDSANGFILTFDTQNVSFHANDVMSVQGAPVTDLWAQLIAILP